MEIGHNSGNIIERQVDIFSVTIIERYMDPLALALGMHVSVVEISKIYRQIFKL